MKLNQDNIVIDSHGVKQESDFGIGDLGMVLDILRSKLYADPIAAICREISCNARDANIEVGKKDLPIKIILPSTLDPNYRIIDQGPGISPDRMENVFVKFASSTKRHTNEMIGGFGLGGKSIFAYSDQFTIITIVDGIKRTYSAYIDASKAGKLALLHQVATDEPNGTEIVVPVQQQHFKEFAEKTEIATRWWDVKPEIVGQYESRTPDPSNIIMQGVDWKIYKVNNNSYRSEREHTVLIDGIAYPFDRSFLDHYYNEKNPYYLLFNGNKQTVVSFPNGQLSLSANRETIHWDDKTKKIVSERLLEIVEEIRSNLQTDIDACEHYFDAVEKAISFTNAFSITRGTEGFFVWRGYPVHSYIGSKYGGLISGAYACKGVRGVAGEFNPEAKVERAKNTTWHFGWKNIIVINDIGIQHLSPKRVVQILNLLPRSYSEITLASEKFLESKEVEQLRHFIPYVKLSEVIGTNERKGKNAKVRRERRLIYKNNGYGTFNLSSAEDFAKETHVKVFVLLVRSYDGKLQPSTEFGHNIQDVLGYVIRNNKVAVYGFDSALVKADEEGYAEFTEDAVPLKDYLETIVDKLDLESMKAAALGFDYNHQRSYGNAFNHNVKENLDKLSKAVQAKDLSEDFSNYVSMVNKLRKLSEDWSNVRHFAEMVRKDKLEKVKVSPEFDKIKKNYDRYLKEYPMLKYNLDDSAMYEKDFIRDLAEYIDMKHQKNQST